MVIISTLLTFPFSFISTTGLTLAEILTHSTRDSLKFIRIFPFVVLLISPVIGFFADKKDYLIILIIVSSLSILSGILLIFLFHYIAPFCIAFTLNELCLIGFYVSFLPYIMELYGIQESVIIGGIINIFSTLSNIIRAIKFLII